MFVKSPNHTHLGVLKNLEHSLGHRPPLWHASLPQAFITCRAVRFLYTHAMPSRVRKKDGESVVPQRAGPGSHAAMVRATTHWIERAEASKREVNVITGRIAPHLQQRFLFFLHFANF